ncbi:MAG: flavodoxin domain-containing protein [Bacteroidota bacterium]|nr:flavodoxin domain-containing protein [Bacteroidota bacterium]
MKIVEELIAASNKEELIWVNGYLAGIISGGAHPHQQSIGAKPAVNKITISYGTETGNAKKLAVQFAAKAKSAGVNAKLVSLDQYRINDLQKEEYFLSVISTQGEGEPPVGAKKFYDGIHNNGFQLKGFRYGILALGDTSYPLFCKAGEDVDAQLNKLGGQRLIDLQKCDTDYREEADSWFAQVLKKLSAADTTEVVVKPVITKNPTGKKTYTGKLLANINLNDRGSKKQTHHIEIATEDVDYLPGDALGIIPENPLFTVNNILSLLEEDGSRKILYKGEQLSLFDVLQRKVNVVYLPQRVTSKYATIIEQEIPETSIGLLDLLKIYPVKNGDQFQKLIDILEPNAPRLYSISSSPQAHDGEIHLTVARDDFKINEEVKYGLCSDFFCRLPVGATFEFYIHKNNQFRLPEDDKDVIMIGPGTGIAPFRSFLTHRDVRGASGKNWLFFGDQHFTTDFLYQSELQDWFDTGVLTRINTAFSRDQPEKIYVQHKMQKHGKDFFEWLENGAFVYVCGIKNPMSVDVEKTLLQVVQQYGNRTEEEAREYLDQLKEEDRYLKDVY